MKITTLIITFCLIQVSAATRAQITLNEKKASLQNVLEKISTQSGYDFVYSTSDLKNLKVNNINLNNVPIEKALDACFTGQPLQYEIADKTVMIKKKEPFSIVEDVITRIQEIDVHGTIVDETGKPLTGVNIKVKDGKQAVISDNDGAFTLKKVDNKAIIIFSFIGYLTKELNAATELGIIKMEVANSKLDEIQVIAYGTTSRRYSTGNISTIKSDAIAKQPINNPLQALIGRIPGLYIEQSSGLSGNSTKVQIRGQNSISNGNSPLYVVDGIPYTPESDFNRLSTIIGGSNPLSYINSSDIESIDVLKDADATAIYGSRGANGVILITTKRGKSGKTSFDAIAYSGFAKQPKITLLTTPQYLSMRQEAFVNDGVSPNSVQGSNGYAPDLKIWDNIKYTDWQKKLFGNPASTNDAQINMTGGNNNTQFLIGGGFHRETPVLPNIENSYSNEKLSTRFSLKNSSSNQKFQSQISQVLLFDKNKLPNGSIPIAQILAPNSPDPLKDGQLNWENSTFNNNPYAFLLNTYTGSTFNLITNGSISYEILKGLTIKTTLGYNNLRTTERTATPNASLNPDLGVLGSTQYANKNMNTWQIEPQAVYQLEFQSHKLNALLGSTILQTNSSGQLLYGWDYTSDALINAIEGANSVTAYSNGNYQYKYAAIFARLNYLFKDRYILNLTARRDGSSRFGPGKQYANFGSVGAAWLFGDESIVKRVLPFLSYGKVRSSYGSSGNDQIGDYRFLNLFNSSYTLPYQNAKGLNPSALFNPDFAWEINKKLEVAIELGFLKDRIYVSSSYFRNISSNQLIDVGLPTLTGFNSIQANFPAVVKNQGFEFEITSKILTEKLNWKTTFNFSIYNNKLTEFPGLTSNAVYNNTYTIGQPLNVARVFHMSGVDPETGIYKFLDSRGQATTSPSFITDRVVFINKDPKFYGGIVNNFQYRNLELEMTFSFTKQIVLNQLLFDFTGRMSAPGSLNFNIPLEVYENRWKAPGDIATYQRLTQDISSNASSAYNSALNSDFAYVDGTFLRLTNLYLSYKIPYKLTDKLSLKNLKIFFQGRNLLTFSSLHGRQPGAFVASDFPLLKYYTAGLSVSF